MQIEVRCRCGEAACPEWAVVELQGAVQPQPPLAAGDQIRGLQIGRLCCASSSSPSSQPSYTFTVGYHELSGTKVTLKKPLLVLRKKKKETMRADEPVPDMPETELEVIGIIRHKILFKNRPKALISRPQTKEKKILQ